MPLSGPGGFHLYDFLIGSAGTGIAADDRLRLEEEALRLGLATAGPAMIWTIPIVVAGQMLVVLTFGEVASRYPSAGGIDQWSKHLLGHSYAWFAGYFYAVALLVTIAAVAFGSASYVAALFGFTLTSSNRS